MGEFRPVSQQLSILPSYNILPALSVELFTSRYCLKKHSSLGILYAHTSQQVKELLWISIAPPKFAWLFSQHEANGESCANRHTLLLHGYLCCCAIVSRAMLKLLVPTRIMLELCRASAVLRLSWKKQFTSAYSYQLDDYQNSRTNWSVVNMLSEKESPFLLSSIKRYMCINCQQFHRDNCSMT